MKSRRGCGTWRRDGTRVRTRVVTVHGRVVRAVERRVLRGSVRAIGRLKNDGGRRETLAHRRMHHIVVDVLRFDVAVLWGEVGGKGEGMKEIFYASRITRLYRHEMINWRHDAVSRWRSQMVRSGGDSRIARRIEMKSVECGRHGDGRLLANWRNVRRRPTRRRRATVSRHRSAMKFYG